MNNNTIKNHIYFLIVLIIQAYFLWSFDGKFGFNPSDEAKALGITQRIGNSQVPHKDFMWVGFAGSGYLHFYFLLFKNNIIQIERIVSILMFQIYTFCILNMLDSFKNKSLIFRVLIFSVASILNMHFFEFTIWQTLDGIFLIALGSYFYFYSRKINLGLFLIGSSILMKSPFLFSIIFIVFFKNFILNKFKLSIFIKEALYSSLPLIFYLTYIFINGGFENLIEEITSTPSGSGELINSWIHHLGFYEKKLIPLVSLFSFLTIYLKKSKLKSKLNSLNIIFLIVTFSIYLNYLNFSTQSYKPSINLLNLFLIFFIFVLFKRDEYPEEFIPLFVCYSIEFAAIMSIGYRWGLFMSGTVLIIYFLILQKIIESRYKSYSFLNSSIFIIFMILIFANPVIQNINLRIQNIYLDKNIKELTYNLDNLDSRYGNIYTSKNTYLYLESVQKCIEKYNTNKISIFPDNAILNIIYRLDNPLPLDWYETGYAGSVPFTNIRILDSINSESYTGSYIFLQSYKVSRLYKLDENQINIENIVFGSDLLQNIYETPYNILSSRASTTIDTCASFKVLINK